MYHFESEKQVRSLEAMLFLQMWPVSAHHHLLYQQVGPKTMKNLTEVRTVETTLLLNLNFVSKTCLQGRCPTEQLYKVTRPFQASYTELVLPVDASTSENVAEIQKVPAYWVESCSPLQLPSKGKIQDLG